MVCALYKPIQRKRIYIAFSNTTVKGLGGKSNVSGGWEGDREDYALAGAAFSEFKAPPGCLLAKPHGEGRGRSIF